MRILDKNNVELAQADPEAGWLQHEKLLIAHHEAVQAVAEEGHYEVTAEYEGGGKDVAWVVDVAGVKGEPEWDEYEDVLRYTPYTAEELAEKQAEKASRMTMAERLEMQEAALCELAEMLANMMGGNG